MMDDQFDYFPPLRSSDDFFAGSDRFKMPDQQRWTNRVLNNLIYYQTNYFFLFIGTFLLVALFHPLDVAVGFITLVVIFVVYAAISNRRDLQRLKRKYPVAGPICIIVLCYLLLNLFASVIVFMFAIVLPILLILLHASFRMRNMKSKIGNKIESIGFRRTPMGALLSLLGEWPNILS